MAAPANEVAFTPGGLSLADARRIVEGPVRLRLEGDWRRAVEAAAALVAEIAAGDQAVYGINTGFGQLANTRIDAGKLRDLQRRLVESTVSGTGPLLPDPVVRLALALKINTLAMGYSGVRPRLIEALLAVLNGDALPCVPAKGSVGASGDLAPLAHLSFVIMGGGEARIDGRVVSAAEALAALGLEALVLEPKEGLSLINGTQVSAALALYALMAAETVFQAAVVAGAMSVDAVKGSSIPFDDRINALRRQRGQRDVAAAYRGLIQGSAIRDSHLQCERVQDPYSLRCQPQVMGACLDQMRNAADVLEREINAVTDNPLVFVEDRVLLSGGNFHGEPLALAADGLALALAEIGALSERRTALLMDSRMSGLPPFLAADPGLDSGFMAAQITAAALVSENKSLAHPASVDSLPTSGNQEDHVSMSTFACHRLLEMAENAAGVVAIELLAAAHGVQLHRPLETSPALARALASIREVAPPREQDRPITPDLDAVKGLIRARRFDDLPGSDLLPSNA